MTGQVNLQVTLKSFYRFGDTDWTQVGSDIDGVVGEGSGFSIALSGIGQTVAVGSPGADPEIGTNAGLREDLQIVAGMWTQAGADIYGQEQSRRLRLFEVALSADGRLLLDRPIQDTPRLMEMCASNDSPEGWVQRGRSIKGIHNSSKNLGNR